MSHDGEVRERPSHWTFPSIAVAALWTLLVLVVQVGVAVFVAGAWIITGGDPQAAAFEQFLMFAATASTAALALAVSFLVFRGSWSAIVGWRSCAPVQWVLVVLLVVPFAVLASEFTNWVEVFVTRFEPAWLHAFRIAGREGILALNEMPWWWAIIVGCLVPALGEEIYWRGFLSRGLIRRYGLFGGALVSSLLFGAVHLLPVQACGAFVLGLGMQLVFLTTRSLPAAIALHALNNAFAFTLARQGDSETIRGLSAAPDGSVVHTPWLLLASAAAAAGCLLAMLIQSRTRWRLPGGADWSLAYATVEAPPSELDAVPVTREIGWPLWCAGLAALICFGTQLYSASAFSPVD